MNVAVVREADLVFEYDNPDVRSKVDGTLLKLLEPYYHFTGL